jgi:hypothetical protein
MATDQVRTAQDERDLLELIAADLSLMQLAKAAGLRAEHLQDCHRFRLFRSLEWECEDDDGVGAASSAPKLNGEAAGRVRHLAENIKAEARRHPPPVHSLFDDENDGGGGGDETPHRAQSEAPEGADPAAPRKVVSGKLPADHPWFKPLPPAQYPRRRGQLKKLWIQKGRPLGKLEQWKADLKTQLDGRDPDKVSPATLGRVLSLTWEMRKDLEQAATNYGRSPPRKWKKGRYSFKATTIAPTDATPEQVSQHYRRQRNIESARLRTTERAAKREARTMQQQQTQIQNKQPTSYVEFVKATIEAETEPLYAAIPATGEERSTVELAMDMRREPAWQRYVVDKEKLRLALRHRLDDLRSQGRILERHGPGPRGYVVRFVRRQTKQETN